MKDELNYAGYIDRYLDGIMNEEEKTWFEKELIENSSLQAELDLYKKINAAIADKDVLDFKDQLNSIQHEIKELTPFYKTKSLRNVALAIGVAATLVFGIISVQDHSHSNLRLVEKYYTPLDANMNFRSISGESTPDLKKAMQLYESGDYHSAIEMFEVIISRDESRIGLKLYSGISHMEVKDYTAANKRFNQVINHKDNVFVESAQWYLGLCYILTDDLENARYIFEQIAESEGYYQKDAKKILRKL